MATELISVKGGTVTDTALTLPEDMTEKRWTEIGEQLGRAERAVGWWIGDWWNSGQKYRGRVKVVTAEDWKGPDHATCRTYGSVAKKFDASMRIDSLPFAHHRAVVALPPEEARMLLLAADKQREKEGEAPPVRMLRQHVKTAQRDAREVELAGDIERASQELGSKLYGVILADPPWRFEPFSRVSGMDRAADNHYPTMDLAELTEMRPPAAPNCALFMWATAPMLLDAIDLMAAWDFDYRTHWVWVKPKIGTGYWNRNRHELLLLGIRGTVPAPGPGEALDSVFEGATNGHSVKPAAAAELIEEMFPNAACLEMFARAPRLGWDTWGAEATRPESQEQNVPDSGEAGQRMDFLRDDPEPDHAA